MQVCVVLKKIKKLKINKNEETFGRKKNVDLQKKKKNRTVEIPFANWKFNFFFQSPESIKIFSDEKYI